MLLPFTLHQSTARSAPIWDFYFPLFSQSCFVEECRPEPAVCPIPAQLCWSNAPVPDMLAPASRRHPFTPTRTPLLGRPPALPASLLPSGVTSGVERSRGARRSDWLTGAVTHIDHFRLFFFFFSPKVCRCIYPFIKKNKWHSNITRVNYVETKPKTCSSTHFAQRNARAKMVACRNMRYSVNSSFYCVMF